MAPVYWFMRMKQGSKGEDFSKELWEQHLVGVLFGTWRLEVVQREDGSVDKDKIDPDYIHRQCEQPKGIEFTNSFLSPVRTFLCKVSEGDRIVVHYDKALHIGTVGSGYREDPAERPSRGEYGERFKCRPVVDQQAFRLAELPSSYRLVKGTGRGAIQEVKAYRRLVEILDECRSSLEDRETEVWRRFADMSNEELLEVLSDKQWEVLCAEYLRERRSFKPLLLAIGSTLPEIDLCGTDGSRRMLAQCKNNSGPIDARDTQKWEEHLDKRGTDLLFFFARSGVSARDEITRRLRCELLTGEDVVTWLNESPDYAKDLRTL